MDTKSINRISAILLILFLIVLSFFIIKPISLAIISGLIFAYIMNPIYKKINSKIKKPTISAFLVCFLLIFVILIPAWFLVPIIIKQIFGIFSFLQGLQIGEVFIKIIPGAPKQFLAELTASASNFLSQITTGTLNWLINFLVNLPNLLFQGTVFIFVFFFAMRDQDKLRHYVSDLSPLKKSQEKILIKEFKEITSSIIYGYIIIGIIQGIATGIGLFIFGVPRALILTVFAIFSSMFPLFGPWLIWFPAAIFLFAKGNIVLAIGFTIYSFLIPSSIDNILRPYIISRNSSISPVIALVGMIGGLFVFGLMGLILGPLILAYSIIFLTAYKNKQLSSMFGKD